MNDASNDIEPGLKLDAKCNLLGNWAAAIRKQMFRIDALLNAVLWAPRPLCQLLESIASQGGRAAAGELSEGWRGRSQRCRVCIGMG
jgi:hypothetical protein